MPRKQIRHPENYSKAFPSRLRILMDDFSITQQTLADYIGVSRQSVSCYCDGSTYPDWETIVKIADHFEISTDWLLGRSEVRSMDPSVKKVCEYTGLSETAVWNLSFCKEYDMLGPIDYLLCDSGFLDFMGEISMEKAEWDEFVRINDDISEQDRSTINKMERELYDKYRRRTVSLGESIIHTFSMFWECCMKHVLYDFIFGKALNEEEAN